MHNSKAGGRRQEAEGTRVWVINYSRRQEAPGPDAGGKANFYLSLGLF
ncbi:MAG: hypothetical protein F6K58_07945 [Symploca sp. SIO2E9]|nr:hypothetical protein [Symploca sp. SIO2E9]